MAVIRCCSNSCSFVLPPLLNDTAAAAAAVEFVNVSGDGKAVAAAACLRFVGDDGMRIDDRVDDDVDDDRLGDRVDEAFRVGDAVDDSFFLSDSPNLSSIPPGATNSEQNT